MLAQITALQYLVFQLEHYASSNHLLWWVILQVHKYPTGKPRLSTMAKQEIVSIGEVLPVLPQCSR